MGFKFNHYAAKTIEPKYMMDIELFAMELLFAIISTIFSIGGFKAQVPQLAFPCAIVAVTCYALIIYSIYLFISSRIKVKSIKDEPKQT